MNKRILAALSLSLALAAGAQQKSIPPATIDVQVVDGRIQLSRDTVNLSTFDGALVWRLLTPGFRFANDGVVITGGEGKFACEPVNGGAGMRCAKLANVPGATYRYSVNLVDARTGAVMQLPQPNVWIQND
jgi:hypothetical protein